MEQGFISIHREILNFEWYTEPLTVRLYIHLLIKANHKKTFYRGEEIKRGQVYTGRKQLAKETGLTEQNIRTSLKNLIVTKHLTIDSTSHRSVITLKNYNKFQQPNQQSNQQVTSAQPTGNQRLTTYNKDNNEDNVSTGKEKKEKKITKTNPPTLDDVVQYSIKRDREDLANQFFDFFDAGDWVDSKGQKVVRWKQKFLTWEKHNEKPIEAEHKQSSSLLDKAMAEAEGYV